MNRTLVIAPAALVLLGALAAGSLAGAPQTAPDDPKAVYVVGVSGMT